jgi:hypothetical protein
MRGGRASPDDLSDGADYNFTNWFNNHADSGDGELSRDGKKLATHAAT